ncbi:tRNA (adenosine(37)-N6)-dimethylallyltransferase MiaA [Candidatus Sulfurimonas marisnigri]|uniref:tRNA dimethylallyltransferase n=1 Tax=Candidatus Sulfurimonas marisnigri TaxID=2740405 RepID=A0A7S7RPH0_9BACT|nr:tRNA (adenosine(37)-N6)-dimethylallyltransferase MiaA [Candidatus Sulfurimonas marisnigri]QOY54357.1 tRNA (adenosine(37)-N6)-dimethylallyltransferase MiaA [Candidatus Sulfurimonas marisnigri]
MKQLAIIGPTASGKSDLAINIAKKTDAYILSIDSLSIYKEIDIVSAKPSSTELNSVKHFGINVIDPDEYFSVNIFIDLYKELLSTCRSENKNLIIVGGTSFYLKSLLDGLSKLPEINNEIKQHVELKLKNLKECYQFLYDLDTTYMKDISPNDKYRIEKALLIYESSSLTPSEWFIQNPPKPIIENLDIYNIHADREILRQRISKRTSKMLELGLIDEVCALEKKYTRTPHSMNSIGIVEVLEYLDGKVTKDAMIDNISTHTSQLAKRQQTFNRTQFKDIVSAPLEKLEELILSQIS